MKIKSAKWREQLRPALKKPLAIVGKPLKPIGEGRRKVRSWRWFIRWPVYIICAYLILAAASWCTDELMPQVQDPDYGVSFSIDYAQQLGNNWQANYLAILNDLNFKHLRLMSYWDSLEPQPGKYDFRNLDWEFQQANAHNAKISLSIGFRQPRWPECFEPSWAENLGVESPAWNKALDNFITTVMNRYKGNPALESWQLENEARNNWFGGCHHPAPVSRLQSEFNLAKQTDPNHPVGMNLSDEHGLPLGQPTPDAYGFSIYRVVYSTNTPIHFYITYPITDWYHRLRVLAIHFIKHRPVYVHELQLEPWGPKSTQDLTIAQQNQSMSVHQMKENLEYGRKTGIHLQYMWGAEWWYWRMTKFNDPGPWNVIKQTMQKYAASSQ